MRAHSRKWLTALVVALGGAVSLHVTLFSQTQYEYVAVVNTTAAKQGRVMAGTVEWVCESKSCKVRGPWDTPGVQACAALAREVGRIVAYGRPGRQLDASQLAQCNSGVESPSQPAGGPQIRPAPGGMRAPSPGVRGPAGVATPAPAAGVPAPRPTGVRAGTNKRDFDGDGHESKEVGGDDCDDRDPTRYPGAYEVPDTAGKDEDCNYNTFGEVDADHDGYFDARYFNTLPGGATVGGDDCDDTDPRIHPALPEICNQKDDNCDGTVDEGVTMRLWRDLDHDLFGDPGTEFMACPAQIGPGIVTNNYDCDDRDAKKNPFFGNCKG